MKTYEEMIQFVVDQVDNGTLRYYEWAAVMTVAETYSIDQGVVFNDVIIAKEHRETARKMARQAEHRASNEARRLANLAAKQNG